MYVPTGPRNKANSSNPVSTIYGPSTCLINTWTGSFIVGGKKQNQPKKKNCGPKKCVVYGTQK